MVPARVPGKRGAARCRAATPPAARCGGLARLPQGGCAGQALPKRWRDGIAPSPLGYGLVAWCACYRALLRREVSAIPAGVACTGTHYARPDRQLARGASLAPKRLCRLRQRNERLAPDKREASGKGCGPILKPARAGARRTHEIGVRPTENPPMPWGMLPRPRRERGASRERRAATLAPTGRHHAA